MEIKIISVGKGFDKDLAPALQDYLKRIKPWAKVSWVFVSHSKREAKQAVIQESKNILSLVPTGYEVWLTDEKGEQITSKELSRKLEVNSKIAIIIGGAHGVDDIVKQKADFIWSFSKLTLPHQIARLVLTEQLYRALSINHGSKYHHE